MSDFQGGMRNRGPIPVQTVHNEPAGDKTSNDGTPKTSELTWETKALFAALCVCQCLFIAFVFYVVYPPAESTSALSQDAVSSLFVANIEPIQLDTIVVTTEPAVQPADISIELLCNVPFSNGTCLVVFTYDNALSVPVAIEVGERNLVTPGWPDRGQPQLFAPGERYGGVSFLWDCTDNTRVHWVVRSGASNMIASASASAYAVECPEVPTDRL